VNHHRKRIGKAREMKLTLRRFPVSLVGEADNQPETRPFDRLKGHSKRGRQQGHGIAECDSTVKPDVLACIKTFFEKVARKLRWRVLDYMTFLIRAASFL
jgi:hypothetical protein